MRPWARRSSAPPEAVARLALERGERVLASAQDRHGRWHHGTDRALHLSAESGDRRIPWERVDHATWDRDSERLLVVEIADFGEQQPQAALDFEDPGRLLPLIRERVTASIVLTRNEPVEGSRGIKVIGRRSPTRRGDVVWSFWLDKGLDPADPRVRDALDRGLAQAQAELPA
ncbi:MAG: hypothetical protein ACRDP1_16835 [Nocardioidaceae bacterium]